MKISAIRQQKLYNAIAEQVMDLRIKIKRDPKMQDPEKLDSELFYMTNRIWNDAKVALNIKD